MKDLVWTEKYRPKRFEDFIGNAENVKQVKELIKNPLSMPNFCFVSKSPGTGKTSLAHVIKNEIGCASSDFMITNSSDERKIDSIRGMIKDFAMTQRSKRDVPRLILMDEIDGMLSASQEALRFIMEKYSQNCKFILTANKEEQIIEPILSRCKVIRMTETPKESIAGKLVDICLKENVHMEEGIEFKIVDMFFPDMRRMINYIQGLGANITSDIVKTKTQLEDEYYNLLIQKQPFEARKFAISKALDPFDTMKRVLELTLEKENDEVKKLIGYEAAHAAEWMAVGADAEIELFRFGLKFCDIRK